MLYNDDSLGSSCMHCSAVQYSNVSLKPGVLLTNAPLSALGFSSYNQPTLPPSWLLHRSWASISIAISTFFSHPYHGLSHTTRHRADP
ncbi:hypothetical protein CGGC5_v003591 [Colletotrichum fructicola Nara gc5]|uniref:Uncharacterized protein n=1 Tax=Colletotrichum fructicola (strain Nara gc5) TaxID=1213859 RepID=A0A7J6JGG8_COLFN|nr:hypothetical protein CGGC5_v003591 [Colletotrichum fructicola Nara gc5]